MMCSELEITSQEKYHRFIIHISMNNSVAAMETVRVVGVKGEGTKRVKK